MPIDVKHSWLVRSVDELPQVVAEAFRVAREGRPGPVMLIDLPKDVQLADASHLPDHVPAIVEKIAAPADERSRRGPGRDYRRGKAGYLRRWQHRPGRCGGRIPRVRRA